MTLRYARRLVLAVVTLVSMAACQGSCNFGGGFDAEKLEAQIADGIGEQTDLDLDRVECPDDVEEEEGGTFECKVYDHEDRVSIVRVSMLGEGNVEWLLLPSKHRIEAHIGEEIEKQTGNAAESVTCPDDVHARLGGQFECEYVLDDGSSATTRVEISEQGDVRWNLAASD